MDTGTPEGLSSRQRWARRGFTVSLLILAASLGALVMALVDYASDDAETAPPATTDTATATASVVEAPAASPTATTPPTTAPTRVTYAGTLPERLADADLEQASGTADVTFLGGDETGQRIVFRWYVPVVAMGTGVDALARWQVEALARGAIADWAEVGGLPGEVQTFAIDPSLGDEALAAFAPKSPDRTFATYAELLEALTFTSGAWAFVPLEEVVPTVTAIAVEGIDPVRGRGDIDAWPFVDAIALVTHTTAGEQLVETLAAEQAPPLPQPVTVIATGDILQSRCSLVQIRATGDWGAALRGPVGDYLASADLTLGSLDGSIQDIAEPLGCFDHVNLSSPPEVIEALTLAGFDEVTVATNHVFDCGAQACGSRAFLRTIELLEEAGIAVVGGGASLDEALAPAIFSVAGTTFGILGFDDVAAWALEAGPNSPGTAPLDDDYRNENASGSPAYFRPASELGLERFRAVIAAVVEQVDVVIVQVQSGTEDTHDPSPRSIKALRAAVEAGATLVVGNQAHHVQAIEPGAEAFVAYALGNFIYDQTRLEGHTQGYLLEATFHDARLINVRLVPYVIEDLYRPVFAEGEVRTKILNDIFAASVRLAAER